MNDPGREIFHVGIMLTNFLEFTRFTRYLILVSLYFLHAQLRITTGNHVSCRRFPCNGKNCHVALPIVTREDLLYTRNMCKVLEPTPSTLQEAQIPKHSELGLLTGCCSDDRPICTLAPSLGIKLQAFTRLNWLVHPTDPVGRKP